MSYQVLCTFDLKNATSKDYDNAYHDLAILGLRKIHANSSGSNTVIPTTTVLGTYNGTSSTQVAQFVRSQVQKAFSARKFKSEIFIVAGENGTWAAITT